MTADRPGGRPQHFSPDELDGVAGIRPDEIAAEARLARDLEGVAARGAVKPSPDFTDRVMGAVAAEPVPAPVIAAGSALRHGAALGFLASIRDSFRVAFGGGFPVAARAQAMALVLLVAVVIGGSGLATAGAVGLFADRGSSSPEPSVAAPSPSALPSPTPMSTDNPAATPQAPTPSSTPSPSPAATESAETETERPDETEDPAGTAGPGDDGATSSPRPTAPSHGAAHAPSDGIAHERAGRDGDTQANGHAGPRRHPVARRRLMRPAPTAAVGRVRLRG